ncbi:aldo/keto reductase [Brachyspira pilosicoli]|uniref:Aldo/keto reductase n=1 Tax=Brachyspira pilosicoli TaxID=52584 RepID=A0AAJ6GDH9_BRAPL|nr:aldo/keto reductase [Brachyspira pilosicoli]WIH85799.1 aldo/keto reductase [Brachyspira pilosicoli]WIH90340.1 aldo/keto reductase [Brachyspira pilosicoli]WIH92631.1 aldo/keto reductase [Brachyspira pilosicoli]WIH94921.1 aldo/keto reductase [Brachyspira pilosicoli]
MKYVKLNNGLEMPILGFGVYQIQDYNECKKAVLNAIETGYRLIDTAASYKNEKAVGDAIKESGINRKELFITTKLWIQKNGYEDTKKAFNNSLEKLQLDYLDLYLIHQPFGDYYGEWRCMEELYKNGKIKAIGVCNFFADRLIDLIMHNEIVPAVNQVEVNPFYQKNDYQTIMNEYNVQMQSWAPFAEGRNNMFTNEILLSIAKKYNKSIAQIILNWLVKRNIVVIPKTVRKERMEENFNIFDFELDESDIKLISSLDKNESSFFSHQDYKMVKLLSERVLE